MEICIFEDEHFGRLEPLVFARPVFDLLCGMKTLREKVLCYMPDTPVTLLVRSHIAEFTSQIHPGVPVNRIASSPILLINGRLLAEAEFLQTLLDRTEGDIVYMSGDAVAAARLSGAAAQRFSGAIGDYISRDLFVGIPAEQISARMIDYAWDLLKHNGEELQNDFASLKDNGHMRPVLPADWPGVHFVQPEAIYIGADVTIKPGVVLDASKGPVVLGSRVKLMPNCVIDGPVYLADDVQVKPGAWIYDATSLGKGCRVGGEVEHVIMHPYSNKQHAGFLGNACLGSWVNLGADTNCSDLKNNYSTVSAIIDGNSVNTGLQFLGLLMGDHSKSAINTMFNTGTVVGFSSNIYGGDFPPKAIPSFSWGGAADATTYDVAKALETARRVLARRNKTLSPAEEKLFTYIFGTTQGERRKRGYPN
jgi:UDP-N-acetylglucosamine diphosphorylase/glucosamine-1-phosphate N-acetyltransferase